MKAIDQLLLASHMRQQVKQGGALQTAKDVANFGSYFIPGVGTARMGYDAFNDFRGGNYLGGAANLLGAGLSLIPGAGGFLGKGVSAIGRLGAKGLARVGAPTLGKAMGAAGGMAGRGLTGMGNMVDRGVARVGQGMTRAVGAVPRVGGMASGAMRGVGNMAVTRPGMTGLVGAGGVIGLHGAQANVNAAKEMQQQQQSGMRGMMNMMRSRPIMNNPLYARPGGY